MDIRTLSGTALAYVGDAAFETLVRKTLLLRGLTRPKDLNRHARRYVTAVAQSSAAERILPLLDEEENEVFRRGRNASGLSAPKSADTAEYRRATGLEALFGWLYLNRKNERMIQLFRAGFPENEENEGE